LPFLEGRFDLQLSSFQLSSVGLPDVRLQRESEEATALLFSRKLTQRLAKTAALAMDYPISH
jgi:hypothetical protein